MKMNKNLKRSEAGFSFLELMIVVAIIAILTAVAIPEYSALQLRALQSEATMALDDIKTKQLVHKSLSETGAYASLVELGFEEAALLSPGAVVPSAFGTLAQIEQMIYGKYTSVLHVDWIQGDASDYDAVLMGAQAMSPKLGNTPVQLLGLDPNGTVSKALWQPGLLF